MSNQSLLEYFKMFAEEGTIMITNFWTKFFQF